VAERVDGEDVAAACAVLASLGGTDLAEVVSRRLAAATIIRPTATPPTAKEST
jgi:hypothetical protein